MSLGIGTHAYSSQFDAELTGFLPMFIYAHNDSGFVKRTNTKALGRGRGGRLPYTFFYPRIFVIKMCISTDTQRDGTCSK